MKPLLVLTLLCISTHAMADDSLKDFTGVWASAPHGLAQARLVCDKYLRNEFQTKHEVLDPGYTIIDICPAKIEQLYLPIRRSRYVFPAVPNLHSAPPCGEQWLHEIKFEGWRIQLHKHGRSAAAFQECPRPFKPRPLNGRRALVFERRALPDYRRRARGVRRQWPARFLPAAFPQTRSRPLRVGIRPIASQWARFA